MQAGCRSTNFGSEIRATLRGPEAEIECLACVPEFGAGLAGSSRAALNRLAKAMWQVARADPTAGARSLGRGVERQQVGRFGDVVA